MYAIDIHKHMQEIQDWVDWERGCDGFKYGRPERKIQAVAVGWMATIEALTEARNRGCNMFITHEPTFYAHSDSDPSYDEDPCTLEKKQLLDESGMVVYRCHDVWDRMPRIGILDSWAVALGLGKTVGGGWPSDNPYMRVHEIEPTSIETLAAHVATVTESLGLPAVQMVGDPGQKVARLAIGTGAITKPKQMYDLGADGAVVTEVCYWHDVRWSEDMRFPLIICSHAVSEAPGLQNLAAYLRKQFPDVRVEYVPVHCPFRLVTARGRL